jgi:hypothetical protein
VYDDIHRCVFIAKFSFGICVWSVDRIFWWGYNYVANVGTFEDREREIMAKTPKYAGQNPLDRLHEGEPFFFIRAQDKLSVAAVIEYSHLLRYESIIASSNEHYALSDSLNKQADEVLEFAQKFKEWQESNSDLLKYPD